MLILLVLNCRRQSLNLKMMPTMLDINNIIKFINTMFNVKEFMFLLVIAHLNTRHLPTFTLLFLHFKSLSSFKFDWWMVIVLQPVLIKLRFIRILIEIQRRTKLSAQIYFFSVEFPALMPSGYHTPDEILGTQRFVITTTNTRTFESAFNNVNYFFMFIN